MKERYLPPPLVAPEITVQPTSSHKNLGETATFTVTAAGNPAVFTYDWRKNGVSLSNGYMAGVGTVSGQNTNTLEIATLEASAEDNYDVIISNTVSPDATSNEVRLFMSNWLVGDVVGADYINLQALVDSGLLISGDIVELSGTVDDSASSDMYASYIDITLRKRVGDINKPIVLLGTGIHFDYATCSYEDIIFRANGLSYGMITGFISNVSISNCEFYDDNYSAGTSNGRAILTQDGSFSITNCIFKDFAGSAIVVRYGLDLLDNCVFDNVGRIHECLAIDSLDSGDVTIKNCIFKNIGHGVIATQTSDYLTLRFLNNTIYSFGEVFANCKALHISSDYAELHIYNNIIHGNSNANTTGMYIDAPTVQQDYNCIFGCTTAYAGAAVAGPHNVHTDPLFTNVGAGDFTLLDASPCIDAGAGTDVYANIPVVDYAGASRPLAIDANWDMGAYERALPASGPQINTQPLSQQVSGHTNVTFTVEASGGVEPLSYQWSKDDVEIEGAISDTLILTSVTDDNQGSYTVVVTDDNEASVESEAAILVVYVMPKIVIQPIVVYGSLNAQLIVSMTILSDIDVPLTYQWTRNNVVVSVERNLYIPRLTQENDGYYVLTVTNEYGTDVSDPVDVRIYSQEDIIEESTKQSTRADVAKKIENILEVKRILKSKGLYL